MKEPEGAQAEYCTVSAKGKRAFFLLYQGLEYRVIFWCIEAAM